MWLTEDFSSFIQAVPRNTYLMSNSPPNFPPASFPPPSWLWRAPKNRNETALKLALAILAIFLVTLVIATAVNEALDCRVRDRAIKWAVEVEQNETSQYVLVKTKLFNGREWKTYRHATTGELYLLSPQGSWIPVKSD